MTHLHYSYSHHQCSTRLRTEPAAVITLSIRMQITLPSLISDNTHAQGIDEPDWVACGKRTNMT